MEREAPRLVVEVVPSSRLRSDARVPDESSAPVEACEPAAYAVVIEALTWLVMRSSMRRLIAQSDTAKFDG